MLRGISKQFRESAESVLNENKYLKYLKLRYTLCRYFKVEPACKISTPKVIKFKSHLLKAVGNKLQSLTKEQSKQSRLLMRNKIK